MTTSGAALSAEQPFPGLRPYASADHDFFFGREDQIYSLFRMLDRSGFIAVVGSSGSGKSSLVRAGLLPLLEAESKDPGGRSWHTTEMRPGDHPLAELAKGLADLAKDRDPVIAVARRERILFALRRSSFGLQEALDEVDGLNNAPLVLLVDQFEELFRYSSTGLSLERRPHEEARWREKTVHFVQLLLEISHDPKRNVFVLITMRSDFIGDCARFYGLPEAVSASQYLVPALSRNQVEEIIRAPVEKAGATIEPALVERLINDSGNELDSLPVLQHCLLRVWEQAGRHLQRDGGQATGRRDGTEAETTAQPEPRHLSTEDYRAIGGIESALSRHADKILSSLNGLEVAVEQVFRALSEVDREGRATRRALTFSQLRAETGVPEDELRRVLERFRAADCSFLVPSPTAVPKLFDDTRIDVGHEALLRRWERVSAEPTSATPQDSDMFPRGGWLQVEEGDGRLYRGLLALAGGGARSSSVTLPLDQVERFWAWWSSRPRTDAWAERYGGGVDRVRQLFDRSLVALQAKRKAEQDAEIARIRRQRHFLAWTTAGLVIAVSLVGLAYWEYQAAEIQRQAAETQSQRAQKALALAAEMGASSQSAFTNKLFAGLTTLQGNQFFKADIDDVLAAVRVQIQFDKSKADLDPTNIDLQARIARKWALIGDVLGTRAMTLMSSDRIAAYRAALEIMERVVAAEPKENDWQRQLGLILDRIGDFLLDDGKVADAEAAYRKTLSITNRLVELGPNNVQWLRDKAVGYLKIGDIAARSDKASQVALEAYQTAAMTFQNLIDTNSKTKEPQTNDGDIGLAISKARAGDILVSQKKAAQAIESYRSARDILGKLTKGDPGNQKFQIALADVDYKIGDALKDAGRLPDAVKEYRGSLTITAKLAAQDNSDQGVQNDLGMRHEHIGDLLKQIGDLAGALSEYQAEQAIVQSLAEDNQTDVLYQDELAAVAETIGDLLASQGQGLAALNSFRAAFAIREHLAKASPHDVQALRNMLWADWLLAKYGDESVQRFKVIVATLHKLKDEKQLTPELTTWLPVAEGLLSKLQEH